MGLIEALKGIASAAGRVGNVLDLPGSSLRDFLVGEDPWDQWGSMTTDENRATGRDLLRHYDLAGEEDTAANFIGGMLAEMLVDPLNLVGGALLGRKAFQRAGAKRFATDKATRRQLRTRAGKSTEESRLALEEHLIEEFGWEPTELGWRGPWERGGLPAGAVGQRPPLAKIRKGPLGIQIKEYPLPHGTDPIFIKRENLPDDIVELAMVASDESARGGVGQSIKVDRAMSELFEAADELGISVHGEPVAQMIGDTGYVTQGKLEDWYEGFGMMPKEWHVFGGDSHLGLWDEMLPWVREPGGHGWPRRFSREKIDKLREMRKRKWGRPPLKDYFEDVPRISPLIKALLAERLINKGLNQFPVLADKGGMRRSHPYAPMDAIEGMDDETRLLYEEHYEDPLY